MTIFLLWSVLSNKAQCSCGSIIQVNKLRDARNISALTKLSANHATLNEANPGSYFLLWYLIKFVDGGLFLFQAALAFVACLFKVLAALSSKQTTAISPIQDFQLHTPLQIHALMILSIQIQV